MNGFAFANTRFKETYSSLPRLDIMRHIRKLELFGVNPKNPSNFMVFPGPIFHLLDFNGKGQVELPSVHIEQLAFSLNNVPFRIKGDVRLENPASFDLLVSCYFSNLKEASQENLKKIDLKITGALGGKVFTGDALFDLDFVKKTKGTVPLEQLRCDFKGLGLGFDKFPLMGLSFKKADLFCKTDTNEYRLSLEDFDSSVQLKNKRFKRIRFKSRLYDGFLYGQARFETGKVLPKITAVVRARDCSANRLEGLLIHFSKVFGRLTSTMYFRNVPALDLRGRVNIQKGYLNNFEFFKWLAQLFDMPQLTRIDFRKASSRFSVNAKGAGLSDINLDSPDVNLSGYFSLGENNLVSSKLSLTFARPLLEQSPKLTPLLRLLDKELGSLCFDFQLSGMLHKMNFRWLQSDFKDRLQKAIPGFSVTTPRT